MYMPYTKNPYLPRLRKKTVDLVLSGWSVRGAARHIGVEPSTVSRWVKKVGWKNIRTIPTLSSRPHSHPGSLAPDIVQKIIDVRKSRGRCAEVVHEQIKQAGYAVSMSSVKRTLDRYGLTKKRSPWKRYHAPMERPFVAYPGDLIEIDTVHIGPHRPGRLYVYTLLDVFSRWAWAAVALQINTHRSIQFVEIAQNNASFGFRTLQSDHGSEFSTYFTENIQVKGVAHRHSRVRQPNDNAHLERFNRTIQEECLNRISQTFKSYQKEIPEYIRYYNNERLHLGLELKTPQQVLRSY